MSDKNLPNRNHVHLEMKQKRNIVKINVIYESDKKMHSNREGKLDLPITKLS